MELQATALQGIVKSLGSNELFYLLPIQDLSALQLPPDLKRSNSIFPPKRIEKATTLS